MLYSNPAIKLFIILLLVFTSCLKPDDDDSYLGDESVNASFIVLSDNSILCDGIDGLGVYEIEQNTYSYFPLEGVYEADTNSFRVVDDKLFYNRYDILKIFSLLDSNIYDLLADIPIEYFSKYDVDSSLLFLLKYNTSGNTPPSFTVTDLSDFNNPKIISQLYLDDPETISVNDSTIIIYDNGLKIYELKDSNSVNLISHLHGLENQQYVFHDSLILSHSQTVVDVYSIDSYLQLLASIK